MDSSIGLGLFGLLAVVLLVLANGFFVAAEFSLVAVRRTRIEQLATEGSSSARAVRGALKHLDMYIAATQLGITLASLALGWIGEPAVARLMAPLFASLDVSETTAHGISIAVAFTVVTMLHIIFGELAPKAIALQRPEATSLFVVRPIRLFLAVFRLFIKLMNGIGNSIVRLLGFDAVDAHGASVHSPEELQMLVETSEAAGVIDKQEREFIDRVFHFSEHRARQVMVPRTKVVAVPVDITLMDLLTSLHEEGYTRYPVYEEDIDRVVGMLHIKDLMDWLGASAVRTAQAAEGSTEAASEEFDLRNLMRPTLHVPEGTSISVVMGQMRRERVHLAVVLDEYGGTSGIITLEDILEEIVGEMSDEFEGAEDEQSLIQEDVNSGELIVSGLIPLDELNERLGLALSDEDYDTLGGYLHGRLSRAPEENDEVPVGRYLFRVSKLDGMRIDQVSITAAPILPDSDLLTPPDTLD